MSRACRFTEPWSLAYALDELDPLSRWRMRRHLGSCAECRSAVADLSASYSELQALERPGLPSEALTALGQQARRRLSPAAPAAWLAPARKLSLAVATILLAVIAGIAVIAGVGLYRTPTSPPKTDVTQLGSADPDLSWNAGRAELGTVRRRVSRLRIGPGVPTRIRSSFLSASQLKRRVGDVRRRIDRLDRVDEAAIFTPAAKPGTPEVASP